MGCVVLLCHQTNPTKSATTVASPRTTGGEFQPILCPLVITSRNRARPPDDRAAPIQSNLSVVLLRSSRNSPSSSRNSRPVTMDAMPKGSPRKKMYLQPNRSTTRPPTMGPMMAPIPTTLRNMPMTRPRSSDGNVAVTIAIPVAWTMAAPTPCNTLKKMTLIRTGEVAVSAAPSVNIVKPKV